MCKEWQGSHLGVEPSQRHRGVPPKGKGVHCALKYGVGMHSANGCVHERRTLVGKGEVLKSSQYKASAER